MGEGDCRIKNIIFVKSIQNKMPSAIQYLTNSSGKKSSVVIPYSQWEKINSDYRKLLNKVRVLTGITEGLKEVRKARKTGKKLQTLEAFLDENRG